MPKTLCMEQVYERCKAWGVKAVAKELGITYQQLVADLYAAGVVGDSGCPSQREIAVACQEVQQSWSDQVRQTRWESARKREAG